VNSLFFQLPAIAIALVGGELPATEFPGEDYRWNPFTPVQRPPVPSAGNPDWVGNPIDSFIAAGHRSRGLRPRPEAPREVLLRRVYLDLIGLPPSPPEQVEFLEDSSPQAYEKLVDRLLASPHYGERWARHWMDIWRYADQDRNKVNDGSEIPPNMWRWRDWIVESLNADKGYDAMVREMLAGDECAPSDQGALQATGFLARNKAKSRDVWLHATVDHTLQAFAGLTIQCARCHDHPVDAITQKEYYQLRAVFEPHSIRDDGFPRAYDANPNPKTWLYVRGNELVPDKENPIAPGVPILLKGAPFQIEPVAQGSTGRRLALAQWLGDRNHPLTARVAVNHIWARHFGRALESTVNDFGKGGEPPSHPALLDWLAADLMEHGWKMKRLHRLIVTSATYRLASTPTPRDENVLGSPAIDPDNHFLWRFAPRRIEAELVRDGILAISGRLDRTQGGAPLEADRGEQELRRSLYFRHGPNTQMTLLTTFDGAVPQECYQRTHSVQPQQALALLNSQLVLQSSRHLARSLNSETNGDAKVFIEQAFLQVLARPAADEERKIGADYLREQLEFLESSETAKQGATNDTADLKRPSSDPALRARENLVHLLFNHHEFVTIR